MNNKSALSVIVLLTIILGLSPVPVTGFEGLVYEDIEHTVFDPTDDIHVTHTGL